MTFHNEGEVYEVAIAGGGPVGLFLACELRMRGVSVLVLEKLAEGASALKAMPFGVRGLNAPTVEAMDRRGMLEELAVHTSFKTPHKGMVTDGPGRQVGHFAGIPLLAGKVDELQWEWRLPGSTAVSLLSTMEEVEAVLGRRAAALGVEIRRGLGVTGYAQDETAVLVEAGEASFRAQWLVGCDGSRSVVRKAGGFAFEGTEPEFTGYSTQVDLADPEKLQMGRVVTAEGMYLQSQPGFVVLQDFDGGAFHDAHQPITREHVQAVLRRISGTDVTVTALHAATTWTDRARQATTYRKGRVLLAGDAAHIHAPLGGQGLNLGVGDAMNLGWKLADVVRGAAPEGLLDSYERERQPVGAAVLDWSRAQVAIMRPDPEAQALYAIFRDVMSTRDGATYVASRLWGVATRYESGGHPLMGRSVPNFELRRGLTTNAQLRDGRGLLLSFADDVALEAVAMEFGVGYMAVAAKECLGLRAVLVRPDGIVAWASDSGVNLDELRVALAQWFPRGEGR